MKNITTSYDGLFSFYYKYVIKKIIKIGNLNKETRILDFGCGTKQLEKILLSKNIINYDIDSKYSEVKDYEDYKYDIIVINQVFMYMDSHEIEKFITKEKNKNKNCKLVVAVSKHNFFVKILKKLFFQKKISFVKSNFDQQLSLIKKLTNIEKSDSLFSNLKIYLLSFK